VVTQLLPTFTSPVILDADALNALDGNPDLLLSLNVDAILTPHVREWERLFGALPSKMEDVIKVVKEKASQYKVTLVLKGVPTCIASPKGEVYLVGKANSGLAKGGSGDVLAGIILALLAQGLSTLEAAILGTWVHAEAGQRTRKRLGAFSMLPTDLIDSLPSIFMGESSK
jgi:NAD(P)H-hydrate epimerase